MKKLLFVLQSLYNGGAEKSLVNLLNELPNDKYEVDLLLFRKEGMFLSQVPEWVNILDTPEELKQLFSPVRQSRRMMMTKVVGTVFSRIHEKEIHKAIAYRWKHYYSKKIKTLGGKYDVAVAYISAEVMYFVGDKVDSEKKFVWIHNDYIAAKHPKEYDYPYLKMMGGIVSISDECVNILKKVFPEFRHKIYMIENINTSSVVRKRADEFVPSEFNGSENNIVSIGRLDSQKGFDLAIRAANILKEHRIPFKWFVLGNGPLKNELQRQVEEFDLTGRFILLGAKENPYVYLKHCTVFVQTSRYEGKSVVLDEAKIIGAPIVVTNYPTVKDQIEDEKEGIIVPMDSEGIAEGIERMLTDTSLRERIQMYLSEHEYGNQDEVLKYMDLIDV